MAVNGREGWRRRAALRNAPPGLHSGQPDPTLVARLRATTTLVERKLPQTLSATHLEVDAASRKPCTLTAIRAGKFCSERTPRYTENPHSPAGWGFRDGQPGPSRLDDELQSPRERCIARRGIARIAPPPLAVDLRARHVQGGLRIAAQRSGRERAEVDGVHA